MQPADMIYQPSNPRRLLYLFCLCVPHLFVCLKFSRLLSLPPSFYFPCDFCPLVHYSFSNFSPLPQYPVSPLPPLCSGERPVIVAAPSEAWLPVATRGGWRTWEHHNVWWRGWRRGRHCCLWHCRTPECPPQLTLTRLSHTGQQECVSRQ